MKRIAMNQIDFYIYGFCWCSFWVIFKVLFSFCSQIDWYWSWFMSVFFLHYRQSMCASELEMGYFYNRLHVLFQNETQKIKQAFSASKEMHQQRCFFLIFNSLFSFYFPNQFIAPRVQYCRMCKFVLRYFFLTYVRFLHFSGNYCFIWSGMYSNSGFEATHILSTFGSSYGNIFLPSSKLLVFLPSGEWLVKRIKLRRFKDSFALFYCTMLLICIQE